MTMSRGFALLGAAAALGAALLLATVASAKPLQIGGTGAGIAIVRMLAEEYMSSYPDQRIEVLPSMGSSGGLRALTDGKIEIAMIGRPLRATESARGMRGGACLRTPLVLATSAAKPPSLARADVARLFGHADARWPDGSMVRVVLRYETESSTRLLVQYFPQMGTALEAARKRMDVPTALTDQENADIAEQMPGSLTAMAMMQILAERRRLHMIPIDGVWPTIENLESGAYPFVAEVHLVLPELSAPAARQFVDYLLSSPARDTVRSFGAAVAAP